MSAYDCQFLTNMGRGSYPTGASCSKSETRALCATGPAGGECHTVSAGRRLGEGRNGAGRDIGRGSGQKLPENCDFKLHTGELSGDVHSIGVQFCCGY
jgi:hypothetical protein